MRRLHSEVLLIWRVVVISTTVLIKVVDSVNIEDIPQHEKTTPSNSAPGNVNETGVNVVAMEPHNLDNMGGPSTEWQTKVIMACTFIAGAEVVIILCILAYWKQIRWNLLKITCPCRRREEQTDHPESEPLSSHPNTASVVQVDHEFQESSMIQDIMQHDVQIASGRTEVQTSLPPADIQEKTNSCTIGPMGENCLNGASDRQKRLSLTLGDMQQSIPKRSSLSLSGSSLSDSSDDGYTCSHIHADIHPAPQQV